MMKPISILKKTSKKSNTSSNSKNSKNIIIKNTPVFHDIELPGYSENIDYSPISLPLSEISDFSIFQTPPRFMSQGCFKDFYNNQNREYMYDDETLDDPPTYNYITYEDPYDDENNSMIDSYNTPIQHRTFTPIEEFRKFVSNFDKSQECCNGRCVILFGKKKKKNTRRSIKKKKKKNTRKKP
jgi:hypothetical protein